MKTRAAVLYELNKPLRIETVEIPRLKRGQVLVKILFSGVCRAQYNEMIGLKGPDRFLPHLLGHEAAGFVVDAGPGITRVKAGDYVALSWIKGAGLEAGATKYRCRGETINAGGVTTFSEHAVVSENRVTRISRRIAPDVASIIGCAVVTGAGIVNNTLQARPGTTLAVFGVGGIGLNVIMAAKIKGCAKIIAVDVVEKKLRLARRFGATHVIQAGRQEVLPAILRLAKNGLDYAVDASGNKQAMETGFAALAVPGTLVIAGNLAKDERIVLHPFELIKGKRILGTWGGETVPQRDIPLYVRKYCQGQLPLDQLITHRLKLEEINQAFELLIKGETGRIVIDMA